MFRYLVLQLVKNQSSALISVLTPYLRKRFKNSFEWKGSHPLSQECSLCHAIFCMPEQMFDLEVWQM